MALGPDKLAGKGGGSTDPGTPFAITPNDSTDLLFVTRMISVSGAGNIAVDTIGPDGALVGTNITLAVTAGSYPWRISRVYSTGTTATGIVGTR